MYFSRLFVVFFVVLNTYRRRRSDAKTTISIHFSIVIVIIIISDAVTFQNRGGQHNWLIAFRWDGMRMDYGGIIK